MNTIRIALLVAFAISVATGQSLLPVDQPKETYQHVSEAFEVDTTVFRSVGDDLVHYQIRFSHPDVVGTNRGWYLSSVFLSVTDEEGMILSQAWLDVSGVTHTPPDKAEFRMIRFTVSKKLEGSSVLSIGTHRGMRIHFQPYRLGNTGKDAEQDVPAKSDRSGG